MQNVSELMDGELDADATARQFARLKSDTAARDGWDTYHMIGDVMRGESAAAGGAGSPAFTQRFAEALAQEPTVLAPQRIQTPDKSRYQTYWLSAAASLAAIAVVGGIAFNVMKKEDPQTVVATVAQPASVVTLAPVNPAPVPATLSVAQPGTAVIAAGENHGSAHMHEYLLAHQGISPTTAIQGVTPYVRTVSVNGDDD